MSFTITACGAGSLSAASIQPAAVAVKGAASPTNKKSKVQLSITAATGGTVQTTLPACSGITVTLPKKSTTTKIKCSRCIK